MNTPVPPNQEHELRINRYMRGARKNGWILLAISVTIGGMFIALGLQKDDTAAIFAGLIVSLSIGLLSVYFLLRQVQFIINLEHGTIRRKANWAGWCLRRDNLLLSDFTELSYGWYEGRRTLPTSWLLLIGKRKYTLLESGDRDEVIAMAIKLSRLLGLPVAGLPK